MERPLSVGVYVAAGLAFLDGTYMIGDAAVRFLTGDFIRIGGQLGPWSGIVLGLGGNPLAMGPVFLFVGAMQTIAALGLVLRLRWGYPLTLVMAIGTMWYLVFGTVSSGIQIALLLASRSRLNTA